MLARWCVHVILIGAMAGLVTSCAGDKKEPSTSLVLPNTSPALQRIGERAEEIIAAAADDNWPRVFTYVRDIHDAWLDYKQPTIVPLSTPRPPSTLLHGRLDAAMGRLRAAAAARKPKETMRAANDVDAAALELFEYYNPTIPPDLHKLRALQRRIALDAADGKVNVASDTLRKVRSTWSRVRPIVEAKSGATVTTAFESTLAAQQAAINKRNAAELGISARDAMAMLDDMQQLSY